MKRHFGIPCWRDIPSIFARIVSIELQIMLLCHRMWMDNQRKQAPLKSLAKEPSIFTKWSYSHPTLPPDIPPMQALVPGLSFHPLLLLFLLLAAVDSIHMSEEDKAFEARLKASFESVPKKTEKDRLTTTEQKQDYDMSCSLKFEAFLDCNCTRCSFPSPPYILGSSLCDLLLPVPIWLTPPENGQLRPESHFFFLLSRSSKGPDLQHLPVWTATGLHGSG